MNAFWSLHFNHLFWSFEIGICESLLSASFWRAWWRFSICAFIFHNHFFKKKSHNKCDVINQMIANLISICQVLYHNLLISALSFMFFITLFLGACSDCSIDRFWSASTKKDFRCCEKEIAWWHKWASRRLSPKEANGYGELIVNMIFALISNFKYLSLCSCYSGYTPFSWSFRTSGIQWLVQEV